MTQQNGVNGIPQDIIYKAALDTDILIQAISSSGGNLNPAFEALEQGLAKFEEAGFRREELLPSDSGDEGIGFAAISDKSGKGFWNRWIKLTKKSLCERDGQLSKAVRPTMQSGTGAIVTAIMTTIGLPVAAITVVVPIAAILVTLGIDAFCENDETNEP